MKKSDLFFYIGIGLIALIMAAGCYWYFVGANLTGYYNSAHKLSLTHPKGWEVKEGYQGALVIFISPKDNALDFFQENINISTQNLSNNPMTLEQLSQTVETQMRAVFKQIDIVTSQPTKVAGVDGYRFIFEDTAGQYPIKTNVHWFIKGDTAYIVTYMAIYDDYETFLPDANRLLSSIKFK